MDFAIQSVHDGKSFKSKSLHFLYRKRISLQAFESIKKKILPWMKKNCEKNPTANGKEVFFLSFSILKTLTKEKKNFLKRNIFFAKSSFFI